MANTTWLELRSGAPGLGGPFLLEHMVSYRDLRQVRASSVRLIACIGSAEKRAFLRDHFPLSDDSWAQHNIQLKCSASFRDVLLDCELHNNLGSTRRINGGPRPGNLVYHKLSNNAGSPSDIAFRIYANALMPLTSVTLLFVTDLGGWNNVYDLLALWATQRIHRPPEAPSTIVLISADNNVSMNIKRLYLFISGNLLDRLRTSEPTTPYTHKQLETAVRECFQLDVIHNSGRGSHNHKIWSSIVRDKQYHSSLPFRPASLVYLLRTSLAYHILRPDIPFDLYIAAKQYNPVPGDFAYHISGFMRCEEVSIEKRVDILASTILSHARSRELCRKLLPAFKAEHDLTYAGLPAETLFAKLYHTELEDVEKSTGIAGLRAMVLPRVAEIDMKQNDISNYHLMSLKRLNMATSVLRMTCIFCAIRSPKFTLDCSHRLCEDCATKLGQSSGAGHIQVEMCPFCRLTNSTTLVMKPPTAGLRLLRLGGQNATAIWNFLRQLSARLNIGTIPLWQFFDGVIATQSGIYFGITIFLERWPMSDCAYHVPKLRKAKFKAHDVVDFGGQLQWDLREFQRASHINFIVQGKRRLYSNFLQEKQNNRSLIQHLQSWIGNSADISVQYSGGQCNESLVEQISFQLISYLFYIELLSAPLFYHAPDVCRIRVSCRVPPGPTLMVLLMMLHQRSIHLRYRSYNQDFIDLPICTAAIWSHCGKGQPFLINLDIEVFNMASLLEVQLGNARQNYIHISKCPYRLEDLIRDQRHELCDETQSRARTPNDGFWDSHSKNDPITEMLEVLQTLIGTAESIQ